MYPDETPYYEEVQELPTPIQKEMALLRQAALQRFGDLGVISSGYAGFTGEFPFANINFF